MNYKSPFLIIAILFLMCQCSNGQSLINWDWKNVTNISYQDIEFKNNFIYAAGNFTTASVTVGSNTYVNAGGSDIIICKMDTMGNSIWSLHIGGSSGESLNSICVDNNGNVLVIGTMEGTLIVGSTTLNSIGGTDILMIKFDSSGNVLLAKNVGTSGNDGGLDITTDYNNDIYAVGVKSTSNMHFAATNNTNENAILKWSSGGAELYMHYMFKGVTWGMQAIASTSLIKYSSYDSTIIIGGDLSSGSDPSYYYYICHSSNINLYVSIPVSATWGATHGYYLCKTDLNGLAQKLGASTSPHTQLFDISTNPVNGDFYISYKYHNPSLLSTYNYWRSTNANWTNSSSLPINLSLSPSAMITGGPLKINYFNNSLYGLLYHKTYNSNCTDYYAAKLDLITGVSELKNLDYETYNCGVGFNGTFLMGTKNTIGKSSQANSPVPAFSLNQAPDLSYCSGTGTGAKIGFPECYYVKGGTPPYTFSWLPATGLSTTNIPQPYVYSGNTATYTLTVTDSGGNVVHDTINVVEHPNPIVTHSYAPSAFCSGDTVAVSLSGASYYYTSPKYFPFSGSLSNPFLLTPTNDTSFEIKGYNAFGCFGTTQVTLDVNPLPTPIISWSGIDLITQPYYTSYQWLLNNIPITGANDSLYSPSSLGYYIVKVSDSNGCVNTSSVLNLFPLNTNHYTTQSVQVFPNPAHSFFTINFPTYEPYKLILTDMSGNKVFGKITDGHSVSETVSMAHLVEGVYMLKVIGEEVYNMKIIRY